MRVADQNWTGVRRVMAFAVLSTTTCAAVGLLAYHAGRPVDVGNELVKPDLSPLVSPAPKNILESPPLKVYYLFVSLTDLVVNQVSYRFNCRTNRCRRRLPR